MEQLILHGIGDYITQTDWMAKNKTKRHLAAFVHALVYTLAFLLITTSWQALLVIGGTHFLIDRYSLAKYVVFGKNWITNPKLKWEDAKATGYSSADPAWLTVWLLIIADNVLHLSINYLALKYLG